MKAYNYFLFRIYMFYKDTIKEKNALIYSTAIVSSLLVNLNLMNIYYLFNYNDLSPSIPNKYYVIIFFVVSLLINYCLFVRRKFFLNQNFQKDKKGGFIIVAIVILTALFFIIIANLNREKIANQKKNAPMDNIQ